MASLKVPIILVDAICFYFAATSPNKPAPKNQRVEQNMRESFWELLYTLGMPYVKFMYWARACAEVISMTGYQFPASPTTPYTPSAASGHITPLFVLGCMFTSMGGLLRMQCYRTLGRQFTFELSILDSHKLVTTGPYAIVRHPSYTGIVMLIVGSFLSHATPGSWLRESWVLDTILGKVICGTWVFFFLSIFISVLFRVPSEDHLLKEQFGKEWAQWAQRVQYKLIPRVY